MVNWESIVSFDSSLVKGFATGKISGEDFRYATAYTNVGGTVRNLLRNRGTTYARRLARKALRRRGLLK